MSNLTANLTLLERDRFVSDFFSIESSKRVNVTVAPNPDRKTFRVTLVPVNEIAEEFLGYSFEDGLLYGWGWSNRFRAN